MARQSRLILPGQGHLVLQRGQGRISLFGGGTVEFLHHLSTESRARGVRVHAYGLYPHEVRLFVTPESAAGLSALMQTLASRHARAFNHSTGGAGSPWQGRFGAAVVDPAAALDVQRYVEAAFPQGDPALDSSASHHVGDVSLHWLDAHAAYWGLGNTPFERQAIYRAKQFDGLPVELAQNLHSRAVNGWAIGSSAFLERISADAARPVIPRKRGRPRKSSVPI